MPISTGRRGQGSGTVALIEAEWTSGTTSITYACPHTFSVPGGRRVRTVRFVQPVFYPVRGSKAAPGFQAAHWACPCCRTLAMMSGLICYQGLEGWVG